MNRPLIIFIVGTTAVGKTKLSVQLCKAIGGQVINCDSKQLYKHASIMTAKANHEQTQGVPHHMLDILELKENCYNRNKYYTQAMACINDIKARGKVPVVIGGTNYYLETLLYNINMKGAQNGDLDGNQSDNQKQITSGKQKNKGQESSNIKQDNNNKDQIKPDRITKQQLMAMTRQQRYTYLQKVDPVMATKLHRNDETRITNFLTRYIQTGIPPSRTYKPLSHQLRFPEQTVLFWIRNQNKKQLHQLMQTRISKMVDQGGLKQILSIFKYADMHGLMQGLKMGALQSIGYKEFYQVYIEVKHILNSQEFDNSARTYEEIQKLVQDNLQKIKKILQQATTKSSKSSKKVPILEKCKQILVKNTIDYSKRQVTWLRNRIFACEQNRDNFFVLQIGSVKGEPNLPLMARFDKNVKGRALDILNQVQQHGIGSIKQNAKQFNESKHETLAQWKKYYCQVCKIEVNGSREWDQHMRSRKHRKSQYASKKNIINQMRKQKNMKEKVQNDLQDQSEKSEQQKQVQQQQKEQQEQAVGKISKKKP